MRTFEHLFTTHPLDISVIALEKFIKDAEIRYKNIELFLRERPVIYLPTEKQARFVLCKINGQINFSDAVEFIQSESGIFPNVEGLSIVMPILKHRLRPNRAVYGFDKKDNLWKASPLSCSPRLVPFCSVRNSRFCFGISSFEEKVFKPKTNESYLTYLSIQ